MDNKDIAKKLGKAGGIKTSQTHDKDWYRENQKKSVEARKRNKQNKAKIGT